ncbi:hypothetical protein ACWXWU_19180 [Shewanella sp. A14]
MNKWISIIWAVLFISAISNVAYADIKETIKGKVKESIFEEFAGELAKLPGLKQIKDQIKENEYTLVSTNNNRGILEIVNYKDIDFVTLSRKRYAKGFNMNREAVLAAGTYWLTAQPKDHKKQTIERKVIVPNRSKHKIELTFWQKGLKKYPLEIVTVPQTATVRIMNIVPKYTFAMPLSPGKYLVEVSHRGYKSRQFNVMLDHNQNNFSVELASLSDTPAKVTTSDATPQGKSAKVEKTKKENSFAENAFFLIVFLCGIGVILWLAYRLLKLLFNLLKSGWQMISNR